VFRKILIANRGEIACRVMRTARRLGIRTVAVHSTADAGAQHVLQADEARLIGPPPPRESYLKGEAIIAAALASGAEAIHPGYGFLSENAAFAEAVTAAGLVFIGPPAAAIRAMGSKSEAKTLMQQAGVPLVPGYHGADQDEALLAREAGRIGYPVLIKASAGGGGKGMRVVERAADFAAQLAGARREAKGAFGDDRVLVEKYLTRPRHIEVQVFGDGHGNCLYLFERDCSLQRRHQKVIEEAPAPGLSPERRRSMGEAAVAAARAIGYQGAGTVEFIAEGEDFYFMEMNTRLQVEHPVTELITGQDLVEWQLLVAAGQPMPLRQEALAIRGHAVEARLYAEDPRKDFLPATGRLLHLSLPREQPGVRVDSGVVEGDEISVHYDPMIAKVIAWDESRPAALARLAGALEGSAVVGSATNLEFLARLLRHPAFVAGAVDTGFIARHRDELVPPLAPADDTTLALAALAVLVDGAAEAAVVARASGDPHSPWHRTDGWRLNLDTRVELVFLEGERKARVTVRYGAGHYRLTLPGGSLEATASRPDRARLEATLGERRLKARVVRDGRLLWVQGPQGLVRLELEDPHGGEGLAAGAGGKLVAPMPGKVIAVSVVEGQAVEQGAPLMILEAMKMEHAIVAPAAGRVAAVRYAAGDLVKEGAELISFEAKED
jgi:3-methylcrotonyl-CoA carboxylase alpha subunit